MLLLVVLLLLLLLRVVDGFPWLKEHVDTIELHKEERQVREEHSVEERDARGYLTRPGWPQPTDPLAKREFQGKHSCHSPPHPGLSLGPCSGCTEATPRNI